MFTEMGY